MSQKHLTKKELNEDPFFEEVAHILDFFRKHNTAVITVIAIIILATIAIIAGSAQARNQNEKAAGLYGIAMDNYNKGQLIEAEDNFMLLAEQYKRTDWGKRAYYYLALVSQKQDLDELQALEYLEKYVSSRLKDNAMNSAAYQMIANHYYRDGELSNAADNYLLAAKQSLSKKDKLRLGLQAANLYIENDDRTSLDIVINYLSKLDLSREDEVRVKALTAM
ncbi:MAG: hypothetical protein WCT23_04165 [Candidatus Neomarinimicrobiota bacterium]